MLWNNYLWTNWINNSIKYKFLETYNLPRLNEKEIENLNKPILKMKIEVKLYKKIPAKKHPELDISLQNLANIQRRINSNSQIL